MRAPDSTGACHHIADFHLLLQTHDCANLRTATPNRLDLFSKGARTMSFRREFPRFFSMLAAAFAAVSLSPAAAQSPTQGAQLLGQFGDWGAYTASPGGKKICFALAKPSQSDTVPAGRPRDPIWFFVSTR